MATKFYDTAVDVDIYNGRCVTNFKALNNQRGFSRDRYGNLYAMYYYNVGFVSGYNSVCKGQYMTSTDNGFTWTNLASISGDRKAVDEAYSGNALALVSHKLLGNYAILAYNAGTNYAVLRVTRLSTGVTWDYWNWTGASDWMNYNEYSAYGYFTVCGDPNNILNMFYMDGATNKLHGITLDWTYADATNRPMPEDLGDASTSTWLPPIDSCSASGIAHIVTISNATPQQIYHTSHNGTAFSAHHAVTTGGASADTKQDPGIAIDGYGRLCAVYGVGVAAGSTSQFGCALSYDAGINWVTEIISAPSGTTQFNDAPSGIPMVHPSVMGTVDNGFLLCGTYDKANVPTVYVKQYTTTTGASGTYSAGSWKQVNSRDIVCPGGQFFRPLGEDLTYYENLDDVHVAYQVGGGINLSGRDSTKVAIFQERLTNKGFPTDPVTSGNFDNYTNYYTAGYIGPDTTKFHDAFENHGTTYTVLKYEPIAASTTVGIGAFDAPVVSTTKAFIDTVSYELPPKNVDSTTFSDAIERDQRKIYLPPDFFIARTVTTNNMGWIRRTIWTVLYCGKEYELTQVVPFIKGGDILYYSANLYVCGPTNDPWSKITPPSET